MTDDRLRPGPALECCENCRHWRGWGKAAKGYCEDVRQYDESYVVDGRLVGGGGFVPLVTLNLDVCSMFEVKKGLFEAMEGS